MHLTDALTELGVPHWAHGSHHHVTEGWVGIDCPFCSPGSGRARLGIHLGGLHANCWQCGVVSLTEALVTATNRSYHAVRRLLGGVPHERLEKAYAARGKLVLPKGIGDLHPAHIRYLRGRGLDPDYVARVWGVRGIGQAAPRLRWRLFVPITFRGDVVSWTTRAIGGEGPRYVSAQPNEEALPHKTLLFGHDLARHAVIICEGPFDAVRVGPGAVALFGLSYTRPQVARLAQFPVRAVCLDSSFEAQAVARKLCRDLLPFPGATYRVELDAADPGSASDKEVRALRRRFLRY